MKRLKFVLQGVGNPDFQQYADISPKIKGKGTLKQIKEIALDYIDKWDLGSGNFIGDIEGNLTISYNGKIWDKDYKEVLL